MKDPQISMVQAASLESMTVLNVSAGMSKHSENTTENSGNIESKVDDIEMSNSQRELLDELGANLAKVSESLAIRSNKLTFEFDETGVSPIVKVVDSSNNEVIREIPSEEFRKMAKALDELADKLESKGMLFERTV